MAVSYEDIHPSGVLTDNNLTGIWTVTKHMLCAWSDRQALINEFLTPWPGVAHPDNALALARSASVKGFGKTTSSSQPLTYEKADVAIKFSTPSLGDPIAYVPNGGATEYIAQRIEGSAEFVTQDHSRLRWGSADGSPLTAAEAPGRMSLGFAWAFTRFNASTVPLLALSYIGYINDDSVDAVLLGLRFNPEQLLYHSLSLNHRVDTGGNKVDYTMHFVFRNHWNQFWRPDKPGGAGWDRIYLDDGTPFDNYPKVSFSSL